MSKYRNHCNTLPERSYYEGAYQPIKTLVESGTHMVEVTGNKGDGFDLILADVGSPIFVKLAGPYTLKRDAIAAAKRCYGLETIKHTNKWRS
jgi:hypothetical protein